MKKTGIFEIEMLPAREGDCFWIRYGNPKNPRQLLFDGGRAATAKMLKRRFGELPPKRRAFELLVVSHVDRDHIEGVLALLEDADLDVRFRDIWFNGYDHLQNAKLETFGAVQGERLSAALLKRGLPWNRAWKGRAVCLPKAGLPTIHLRGGMTLTLLSPNRQKLQKLIPLWVKECAAAGLIPGVPPKPSEKRGLEQFGPVDIEQLAQAAFESDPGEPNGSSIALLASYGGRKVLLSADAHVETLLESIRKLGKRSKRLKLDAFKVSHHASEHNVSKELTQIINTPRYLISTNGSYFKHPSAVAMARLIKYGGRNATFFCNYRTKFNLLYDNENWKRKYGYEFCFPAERANGTLSISL